MNSTWVTLAILLAGVFVVVGGILLLRLHAFLALVLGALVVAALTPTADIERFHVKDQASEVASVESMPGSLTTLGMRGSIKGRFSPGQLNHVVSLDAETSRYVNIGNVRIVETRSAEGTGKALVEVEPAGLEQPLQAGDLLIPPHAFKAAQSDATKTIGARIADGFGDTCRSIGILIAMAAIVGRCLLESGAADRIVRTSLRWFGERGAPAAFMTSGFVLGIPVFFDTVFYLMIPLGKAMRLRVGKNYLLYVLTIVCGATMAHSLVPPTPGPLVVAEELGVDIGLMMVVGGIVGFFCAVWGYLWALVANRYAELPLRDSEDFKVADLEQIAQVEESELPPLWLSLLPIVLPVVFITGHTILKEGYLGLDAPPSVLRIAATLGEKNLALTIAAVVAMLTLVWTRRPTLEHLSESMQAALTSGGIIILITAAGGAFGGVLRETDVAGLIRELPRTSPLMICTFAWLVTVAIRTAQGSATVAMITAVGVMSGVALGGDLGFHPVWIACAIGAGSKPIAWMNDSGFWVIVRMSGMTEKEGLKYVTPMTATMGVVGLIVVLIGVTVAPMK